MPSQLKLFSKIFKCGQNSKVFCLQVFISSLKNFNRRSLNFWSTSNNRKEQKLSNTFPYPLHHTVYSSVYLSSTLPANNVDMQDFASYYPHHNLLLLLLFLLLLLLPIYTPCPSRCLWRKVWLLMMKGEIRATK